MEADLKALGHRLRAARETQAFSLAEVEAQTRIRVKFLEALEEGDLSVLPTTMHAKGFLRNYAQFLGMDVNQIIAEYAGLTGETPPTVTHAPQGPAEPVASEQLADQDNVEPEPLAGASLSEPTPIPPAVPPPSTPPRATYVTQSRQSGPAVPRGLSQKELQPRQLRQRAAPASAEKRATRSASPEKNTGRLGQIIRSPLFSIGFLLLAFVIVATWAVTRLSAIPGEVLTSAEPAVASSSSNISSESAEQTTPTFSPTSTPMPTISGPQFTDRVVVTINVEQRSWIRVQVDGTIAFEGQANIGELLRYEGQREVYILAGNGGGLLITYNGQAIGQLGSRGEVVERFFTTGGQVMPTATPTLTVTPTTVPTPTPQAGDGQ